jgi:hypothetical protein
VGRNEREEALGIERLPCNIDEKVQYLVRDSGMKSYAPVSRPERVLLSNPTNDYTTE